MSLLRSLLAHGARAGGLAAYFAGKAAMRALHAGRRRRRLSGDTLRSLGWLFPALDLAQVELVEGARLVARWFERPPRTGGMAFRGIVYLAPPFTERTPEGLLLLAHELAHVQQIQALGEAAFARRYGAEWVAHGYDAMPLEREAEGYRRRARQGRGAGGARAPGGEGSGA